MSLQTPVHRPDQSDQQVEQPDQLAEQTQAIRTSFAAVAVRRRYHVDRYGLLPVLVAAGGLAAVIALQWTLAREAPRPPTQSTAMVEAPAVPPVRDQWYLDEARPAAPAVVPPTGPPMRDQWYLDSARSVDPGPTAARCTGGLAPISTRQRRSGNSTAHFR